MRSRFLSIVGALAIGSAAFANVAAAQQEGHNIPRTADGRPDLSGTYDIATLTPLQRPETFGDKLTLTGEEAEAIAKKEADMVAKAAEASDPNRDAPEVGGRGVRGRARCAGAGLRGRRSRRLQLVFGSTVEVAEIKINGKWRTSIITDPKNGRRPALTPAAKKRADALAKLRQPNTGEAWWIRQGIDPGPYDNPEMRPLAERCLLGFGSTSGPPMLPVLYNNLKQIVPDQRPRDDPRRDGP